jgi:hypothetical protein
VPVIEEVDVSVAVTVSLLGVFRVKEIVPAPLVRVELAGRVAAPSELENLTVPE